MYHPPPPPIFTSVNLGRHEDASNIDLNELFSDAEMLLFSQHASHFDDDQDLQVPVPLSFRLPSKLKYDPGVLSNVISGSIDPVSSKKDELHADTCQTRYLTSAISQFVALPEPLIVERSSSKPGTKCARISVEEQTFCEIVNPLSNNSERRERNREHAKRSRIRKKFLLESLQDQVRRAKAWKLFNYLKYPFDSQSPYCPFKVSVLQQENLNLRQLVKEHFLPDKSSRVLESCASELRPYEGSEGLARGLQSTCIVDQDFRLIQVNQALPSAK